MKPVYRTDNAEWPFAVIVGENRYLFTDGRRVHGRFGRHTGNRPPQEITLCGLEYLDDTSFNARYSEITRTRPTLIADDIALVGALASLDLSPWTS